MSDYSTITCEMCETFRREGWWGTSQATHCLTCHYTWRMGSRQAHCTYCHRHFTSPSGFDAHLKTGTDGRSIFHLDPLASKGHLSYIRNEQGAWYSPRPEDSYPHDALSPLGEPLGDDFSAQLDSTTREPFESPILTWLPKSKT